MRIYRLLTLIAPQSNEEDLRFFDGIFHSSLRAASLYINSALLGLLCLLLFGVMVL
jgi:hypothetical protein